MSQYNPNNFQDRYADLKEPLKAATSRAAWIFPLGAAFSACLAAGGYYIYSYYDGSCNSKMHKAFLAAGIIFTIDALFTLCNYIYVNRVFSFAISTIEQTQEDSMVDEFLVPHAPTVEPLDLRATAVMDSICSVCLSATYLLCTNIASLVVVVMGLIWEYTSTLCDGVPVQSPGRAYFISVACLFLLRILWCRYYMPFIMLVMQVFRFEHVRWNRAPRSMSAV